MKMCKIYAAVLIASLVSWANASILVSDDFNRPDGSLVGTAPTPGPGGTWENQSGTIGDLLLSGGQAVLQHGVPSEDAYIQFADQSTGILSATFDVTVSDDAVIGGGDYEYFAYFNTVDTFFYRSRVDIVAPSGGGDYSFGISTETSTAQATFGEDFFFGTPYTLTLNFNLDSGVGSLAFGGTTISGTGIVLGQTLNGFSLRQSDSSNNETVLVDNLVVEIIPEPASVGLLGLASCGIFFTRRIFMV